MLFPKHGGLPLPESPICLPGEHEKARRYAQVLLEELDRPEWTATQRRYVLTLYRKWLVRAEGKDSHFEQFGSFPWNPRASERPSAVDVLVAKMRRRHPLTAEERRRRKVVSRLRKRYR